MAEVKLERDTLGWDPAQMKDEADIKQEPEEFPFHAVTVKAEDDDDESPVLRLRPTEGEECGSSDTDCSEDYSHQQAPAKRSYAMIPPDSSVPDSRPFACSDCGKGFKDEFVLQRHVLYVHGGNKYEQQHLRNQHDIVISKETNHIPFSCLECGKTIRKEEDVLTHMRKHSGEKALLCSVCSAGFVQKTALLRHRKQLHNICPVCSTQFQNKIKLNAHLRAHVKGGTLDPGSDLLRDAVKPLSYGKRFTRSSDVQDHRPLQCPECGKRFLNETTLKTHSRYHTGPAVYTCGNCSRSFKSKKSFQRHVRVHAGNKHFACSVCDAALRSKAALTIHMKTHCDERPFACPACEKSFVQRRDLTQHQRKIHHICPICSLGFTGRSELKAHLSGHSEAQLQEYLNPFACSQCGKRFSRGNALQSHMTSHSEERPSKCSVCEKCFKTDVQLWNHMRIHRWQCSECGKRVRKNCLSLHLSTVHHIYVCRVCKERFTDNVGLKEHIMTHVEEVQICSVCGEGFMWKNALLRHEREAHARS